MRVVVCPGHSETHIGVSKNGFTEYHEVKKISDLVNKMLSPFMECVQVEGSIIEKVNKINDVDPVLAVEIHLGNTNNFKIRGSRSFYMKDNDNSKKLSESILNSCVSSLKSSNQGAWTGWYKRISPAMVSSNKAPADWKPKIDLFLSKIHCTSCIIEPFFLSSIDDCNKYISDSQYELIAEAIGVGIVNFLGLSNDDLISLKQG